jgi:hypothetical protein
MKLWQRKELLVGLTIATLLIASSPVAGAAGTFQSSSSSYGVNEVFFGSGGSLSECSTNYCAKTALGEETVGNSSGGNYKVHAGFDTTDQPILQFVVNGGTYDLGILSTGTAMTNAATFSVLAYQSSGYVVLLTGTPPAITGHTLAAMSSVAASSPGTEQFGINVVLNSNFCGAGCNLGANPQQIPSSSFGFGTWGTGYGTANQFRFNTTTGNNVIAQSTSASGETLYTLSMIANISKLTPAGAYTGSIGLVAVATF